MGYKVARLTDRYDLTPPRSEDVSFDEYLERRWTGADNRDPVGYKTLTEWFNKRLLSRLYEEHGRDAMAAHLDREYELITDGDDVKSQLDALDSRISELREEAREYKDRVDKLEAKRDEARQARRRKTDLEDEVLQVVVEGVFGGVLSRPSLVRDDWLKSPPVDMYDNCVAGQSNISGRKGS